MGWNITFDLDLSKNVKMPWPTFSSTLLTWARAFIFGRMAYVFVTLLLFSLITQTLIFLYNRPTFFLIQTFIPYIRSLRVRFCNKIMKRLCLNWTNNVSKHQRDEQRLVVHLQRMMCGCKLLMHVCWHGTISTLTRHQSDDAGRSCIKNRPDIYQHRTKTQNILHNYLLCFYRLRMLKSV